MRYQNGDISVDDDFARFGAKSYAINKINTVEVRKEEPKLGTAAGMALIGLILVLISIRDFNIGLIGIGLVLLGAAYLIFRGAGPTYRLFLMTSSSEVQAFETQDEDQVIELRNAVEAAMIRR